MLLGDFFYIRSMAVTNGSVLATLDMNVEHPIFKGHFPGQPVVPGVCMMQMLKELLENIIEKQTLLRKADYLKFLAIINPLENSSVQVELSYNNDDTGSIVVVARLYSNTRTFLKFKGLFTLEV